MIYVFALSSIAVYGVILGGWASNNKYSFLGGLRSSAQLIAYEIPLGLGILGVVLLRRLAAAGHDHRRSRPPAASGTSSSQPLGFLVFVVAAFCRSGPAAVRPARGRAGTDRRLSHRIFRHEAAAVSDRRIPAHGHGGVPDRDSVPRRLALLGSDRRRRSTSPGSTAILRIVVLAAKILGVIVFFMLVRWSWPRFRFDQLMSLAWKVMLPLGLVNLVVAAVLGRVRCRSRRDCDPDRSDALDHRQLGRGAGGLAGRRSAGSAAHRQPPAHDTPAPPSSSRVPCSRSVGQQRIDQQSP